MPRPRLHRPPLTKTRIDETKKGAKDVFLWDGTEHGLGVKITPAGSKIFILQKTVRGRVRRITLGKFGDMTLDAARIAARKLNGVIADNRDPIAERGEAERRERQEKTMQDLWDRYAAEVIAVENKPRTAEKKSRMWNRRVAPALGKLKVKDVTTAEAGDVVRAPLRIDAAGQVTKGKGEAGNLYRLVHHMFRKALVWDMRPRELGNPLEGVTEPKVERRKRLLKAGEIGSLLQELDRSTEPAQVVAAIKAAVLTGARINELLTLRWDDVRLEESELHLPDTKNGYSERPVSAEALAAIQSVGRMPGSPFVFRAIKDPKRSLSYFTVEKSFRRIAKRAGVRNCTLHTLRHWFATTTANSVNNPRVGMKLTGHKSHTAYMNYVHAEKEQAHELAEQLAALTTGLSKAAPAVVDHPAREKARRA
jgi:integrase